MSQIQPGIMDCKVLTRKYLLVLHSSRWRVNRKRVMVQSPMTEITEDVSWVPVRCITAGTYQNAVCLIPPEDIESESSIVCRRRHVSDKCVLTDAHGVALFDSSSSDKMQYRRGDKFWIRVDTNTKSNEDMAPVINLRTFESGTIALDQACWFPKVRNTFTDHESKKKPKPELWTLGGPLLNCKLGGPSTYRYFSWIICQYLDGSPSTIKNGEVPDKDDKTSKVSWHLSTSESASLFQIRLRIMSEGMHSSTSTSDPPYYSLLVPTPPSSPEFDLNGKMAEGKAAQTAEKDVWKRILAEAGRVTEARRNHSYVLQNSPIHPQNPQGSPDSQFGAFPRMVSGRTHLEADCDSESSDLPSGSSTRSFSSLQDKRSNVHTIPTFVAPSPEAVNVSTFSPDGPMFRAEEDLANRSNIYLLSAADPRIANDPTLIRQIWEANRPRHNPKLDNLCDLGNPECPYTTKYTRKHYHPDPAKCLLPTPPPTVIANHHSYPDTNSISGYGEHHRYHEHCISRSRAYPGAAGECLLAGNPLLLHKCCVWETADLESLPRTFQRAYNDCKEREARLNRAQLYDQSHLVRPDCETANERIDPTENDLGTEGRQFLTALDEGLVDWNVEDMPTGDFEMECSWDLHSDSTVSNSDDG